MYISVPNGGCEYVFDKYGKIEHQKFKVHKSLLSDIPPKNKMIKIYMEGTGFAYNGEIYHKTLDYIYIYLY